jgi:LacI family transcriptional regulator
MPKTKPATLYDVAQRAGVSYQTVSRVINGSPKVAKSTLRRVQKAIQELNYQPNKAAQMLVTRRSFTLELIMWGINYYGPAQMMSGVEHAARSLGYKLIYSNVEEQTPDQLAALFDNLGMVDALLVIAPIQNSQFDDLLNQCNKPYVKIGTEQGASGPSAIIDQRYGSQLAVQHLLSLGHEKIAEISGPLHWHDAYARHQSWLDALHARQIPADLTIEGDWTAESGYQAARELLTSGHKFSALVIGNDQMALGAIRALRECGLRIPQDVSLVGFDDIPEAAYFEPPLTTIRQDFRQLGRQSVEYLIEILRNDETPLQQHTLYPQLIIRQSTGPVERGG